MRKKILCGISRWLLLVLLLSQAAACSESAANSSDESTTPDILQTTAASDPSSGGEAEDGNGKEQYAPVLPAVRFNGYNFRIISRDDSMHTYPVHTRDLYTDEMRGDAINDAVFQRNAKIEDIYDIKMTLDTHNETVSENHALFMTTQIGVIEDLRNMEADFGVLPYPKYDEAQQS